MPSPITEFIKHNFRHFNAAALVDAASTDLVLVGDSLGMVVQGHSSTLPVTLDEAVNGAKVKVPTVEGPVMLTIAPGSSSGQALRLKGRGFVGKNGQRGDQLATLEIVLPADPEELARRLEGWTDGRNVRSRLDV